METNQDNLNQDIAGADSQGPPNSDDSLSAQLDAMQAQYLRLMADFENYKRRTEAERKDLIDFAREVAVAKLLPSIDSLTQGLLHAPREDELGLVENYMKWKVGLVGIVAQLEKAMHELGVEKIPAVGEKFNPEYHEAIGEEVGEVAGLVVKEVVTGYQINGKVIRPSQVIISKQLTVNS